MMQVEGLRSMYIKILWYSCWKKSVPVVLVTHIAIVCGSPSHEWGSTAAEQWTDTRNTHLPPWRLQSK